MYARQFQSLLRQADAMKITFVTTWISLYLPSTLEASQSSGFAQQIRANPVLGQCL
jgi:hypothetical protein